MRTLTGEHSKNEISLVSTTLPMTCQSNDFGSVALRIPI